VPYEARTDMPLLPGERIDDKSPLYVAFAADAEKRGMSQKDFSSHLSEYVRRSRPPAAPTPAANSTPAVPAAKPNHAAMTTRESFAHALTHGSTPSTRG
jgi:hypothetical protein